MCVCTLVSFAGCTDKTVADTEEAVTTGAETLVFEAPETEAPELEIQAPDKSTKYVIIRGDSACATETDAAIALKKFILSEGTDIQIKTDWYRDASEIAEYEIIVGKTNRESADTFETDRELLGMNGYVIASVGTKLFICGGSYASTAQAVKRFIELWDNGIIRGLREGGRMYGNTKADVKSVMFSGNSLSDYSLYCESTDEEARACLDEFRTAVFQHTGLMLPYTEEKQGRLILCSVSDNEDNLCTVKQQDGNLVISYTSAVGGQRFGALLDGIFTESEISVDTEVIFRKKYGKIIYYEDFGAKGNGVSDDFDAIIAAHDYANNVRGTVFAKKGATYLIGPADKRAVIKTDTDWTGAEFIIDDRNVKNCKKEVFIIHREEGSYSITGIGPLKAGQTNIGVKLPGDSIVTLTNSNVKRYIRKGGNANNGSSQTEVIRVDKDGNVSPETPIIWDYDTVTSANGFKIDKETLTLRGGTVTTTANREPSTYNYYYRGIKIYRSNVVIDGLTHKIKGEGSSGAPYYGILIINSCSDITVKNCTFSGHKTYKDTGSNGTNMGSYDITVTSATNTYFYNCNQITDINNSSYWGVFASNFAKNIVFDGVEFSRFDAHQGVMNVTLRNSSFGHQGINLIGSGKALIENCIVYAKSFVNLRSDYGSTWDGDLIIRNCEFYPSNGAKVSEVNLIGASNTEDHDFGYTCHMPRTVTVENLYISDKAVGKYVGPCIFQNFNSSRVKDGYSCKYPVLVTEEINISGITSDSGKELRVCSNTYIFKDTLVNRK